MSRFDTTSTFAAVQYALAGIIGLYLSAGSGPTLATCFVVLAIGLTAVSRVAGRIPVEHAPSAPRSVDHPSLRIIDTGTVPPAQAPERELSLASRAS